MDAAALLQRLAGLGPLMAALLLGGCYETDVALITHGDKAAIAGTHACRVLTGDNEAFDMAITPAGPDAYHFAAPDIAGTVKLKKLDGGRWLLQLSDDEKAGTFYYAFGETMGETGFRALYPRRDDQALAAAAMAKYAIDFLDFMGRDSPTGSTVTGAPDNLMQFLSDPAVHDLAPWFTCTRA